MKCERKWYGGGDGQNDIPKPIMYKGDSRMCGVEGETLWHDSRQRSTKRWVS